MNFDQLLDIAKASGGAILVALGLFFGFWVKGVFKQKQRNDINEIDLSAKKIDFDTHTKPIDDLVSDSNKSHGADDVVKDTGTDDKKG